ncbi:MAG TPA: hypothetical protein VG387_08410 [Rhizomicrobium sp.]|jgi:hypothetical protein|nr:hypothetical protein [Rhizomicrobium sp.]
MDDAAFVYIPFRGLFHAIQDYAGAALYRDVLSPWLAEDGVRAAAWLSAFAARPGDPVPKASRNELFQLYALSRVDELLLANLQIDAQGEVWKDGWAPLSHAGRAAFLTALGLSDVREPAFSPFFHEIAVVEQDADDAAPITVVRELWPAFVLGGMMLSRAGVVVRGGRHRVRKEIAETSRLYWAYRRRNRPTRDLSEGWGSNSQWGTDFRRDYRIGGRLYFNVDGPTHPRIPFAPGEEENLTPAQWRQLLLHRCLICVAKPDNDFWPYDDAYDCRAEDAARAGETGD